MKIAATIEARMNSSRLPGKVLLPILKKPVLEIMVERARRAKYVDEIIVATTINKEDDKIEKVCEALGVGCFRGSEQDVLSRVLGAAKKHRADLICELTGDCPLIDPFIIDRVIADHLSGDYDYTSNFLSRRTFPLGFEVQVFPTSVLEKTALLTNDPADRVHVSYFIYSHPQMFRLNAIEAAKEVFAPDIRLTLDTREDYDLIKSVYAALYEKGDVFSAQEIVRYLRENPRLLELNKSVRQKEVYEG